MKENNEKPPQINIMTPMGPVQTPISKPVITKKTIIPHLKNNCKQLLWAVPIVTIVILLILYTSDVI